MAYITANTFSAAVTYIYENISKSFTLDELALAVGLSVTSLKRLFQEAVGQSPGAFIRKLRMEFSFCQLHYQQQSVLEVALSVGYEDASAFARAFKNIYGYAPTASRKKHNIMNELDCITVNDPDFIDITAIEIQCVTETGLYFDAAPKAWDKLKSALNNTILSDDFFGLYVGIGHDNPHDGEVPSDKVRFTAGVAQLKGNLNIDTMTINTGRYARFRYKGTLNNLGLAYHYIYGKWQENSNVKINHSIATFMIMDKLPSDLGEYDVSIHTPLFTF